MSVMGKDLGKYWLRYNGVVLYLPCYTHMHMHDIQTQCINRSINIYRDVLDYKKKHCG